MDNLYTVPLISQDLKHDETIIQIADILQYLDHVINDLFGRVNARINANVKRTEELADRILTCGNKVKNLTGATKAIQVFSSAKYPSSNVYKNYITLFEYDETAPILKRSNHNLRQAKKKQLDHTFQEKREFFHVKVAQPVTNHKIPAVIDNKSIGKVIRNISTIGSLLIFNTDECLYDIYKNNVFGKGKHYQNQNSVFPEQANFGVLDAAPSSITNKERLIGKDADNYLYVPDMGKVPELDMPLDLPHLPGIAGDLQFIIDAELTIAPSAVISPSISASHPGDANEFLLEEIIDLPDVAETPVLAATRSLNTNLQESPPSVLPPPPPPLPPSPPSPLQSPLQKSKVISQPTFNSTVSVMSEPVTETDYKLMDDSKDNLMGPKTMPPQVDAHSTLMEAIRRAGGAKGARLKAASSVNVPKVSSAGNGGDLMVDLHAKLSMRRKGISGDMPQGSGTVLDKLSALIPPPPLTTAGAAEHSSNEEDWD